jgi:hypothetical protein
MPATPTTKIVQCLLLSGCLPQPRDSNAFRVNDLLCHHVLKQESWFHKPNLCSYSTATLGYPSNLNQSNCPACKDRTAILWIDAARLARFVKPSRIQNGNRPFICTFNCPLRLKVSALSSSSGLQSVSAEKGVVQSYKTAAQLAKPRSQFSSM